MTPAATPITILTFFFFCSASKSFSKSFSSKSSSSVSKSSDVIFSASSSLIISSFCSDLKRSLCFRFFLKLNFFFLIFSSSSTKSLLKSSASSSSKFSSSKSSSSKSSFSDTISLLVPSDAFFIVLFSYKTEKQSSAVIFSDRPSSFASTMSFAL